MAEITEMTIADSVKQVFFSLPRRSLPMRFAGMMLSAILLIAGHPVVAGQGVDQQQAATSQQEATSQKKATPQQEATQQEVTWTILVNTLPRLNAQEMGSAGSAEAVEQPLPNRDPWQGMNQRVYRFNNYFDGLIVRPAARTYQTLVPKFMRRGIRNFFSNINDINVIANDVLQFKFEAAASDCGRLVLNSTVGVGGLFDVATGWGLHKNQEDFGQTLAVWGVGDGPYVMLPVFGASNVRDSLGLIMDYAFNPIQYHDDLSVRTGLFLVEEVDSRERLLALDELMAGDQYLFIREAYFQHREYLVKDGEVEDSFGDF
ncbi:MAG: MlaA family lipoprotein [Pseudohongiellaceae bacterium]